VVRNVRRRQQANRQGWRDGPDRQDDGNAAAGGGRRGGAPSTRRSCRCRRFALEGGCRRRRCLAPASPRSAAAGGGPAASINIELMRLIGAEQDRNSASAACDLHCSFRSVNLHRRVSSSRERGRRTENGPRAIMF
jgi:hypothetical protein